MEYLPTYNNKRKAFYIYSGREFAPSNNWQDFFEKLDNNNIDIYKYLYFIAIENERPYDLVKKHYIKSDKLIKAFFKYQKEKNFELISEKMHIKYDMLSDDRNIGDEFLISDIVKFRYSAENGYIKCSDEIAAAYKGADVYKDFLQESKEDLVRDVEKYISNIVIN